MKWFKHDTDASQDAKLQNVLIDYGLEGYGLYWYCIELIAGQVDKDNITFELEHDARIIARNTGSTRQKVEEMMKYFVDQGLFENIDGTVTCLKLSKRLDKSMTSNPEMRSIIEQLKSHDGVMTESAPSHDGVMQDKNRLDKTRLDKSNKPKAKRFVPPTIDEVRAYFHEKGCTVSTEPQRFFDYYESNGWKVGKNKMQKWKNAASGWISRNQNQGMPAQQQANLDVDDTTWINDMGNMY